MPLAAPPALDPQPTLREMARHRRVAVIVMLPFVLIGAGFAWFAWHDAWMYGQDRVRHTQADVVARWFVPRPDRWWVRYAFVAADGTAHTAEHSLDEPPDHEVGDRIEVVHWKSAVDGEQQMDVVSRDDVLGKRIFYGFAVFTAGFPLLMLAVLLRQQGWRRRLLREGIRIAGTQPSVQHRVLPLGPGIAQWRLCLRHYDERAFAWCDVHSDWLAGPPPELADGATLPPILRDPRRPRRTWIPAAGLARPPA
jgi:hypothetical protein